jgi:hypothetical protein
MPTLYAIGDFEFMNLMGMPQAPQRKLDVVTQPGRDGATIWDGAVPTAEPFELTSYTEIESSTEANETYLSYKQSVGFVARQLIHQGVEAYLGIAESAPLPALLPTKVVVMGVRKLESKAVRTPVGFTKPGLLVCAWTLLPWIVEEEA